MRSPRFVSLSVALTAALAGFVVTDDSAAREFYVSPNGNDADPGTAVRPFCTVNRGVAPLEPGDTLILREGVYAESLQSNIPSGTSWDAPVTVKGHPGEKVVLRPEPGASRVAYFDTFGGKPQQYIVLDGLVLDAINVRHDCVKIDGGGHHLRFFRCEIMNAPNQGILTSNDSNFSEFLNLSVHDNGIREGAHGLYLGGIGVRIEGCRIYNNAGNGLRNDGLHDSVIAYNIIHHNGRHQISPAVEFHGMGGTVMHDNVVYANRCGIGIVVRAPGKIYHNTLVDNVGYGIYLANKNALMHVANNVVAGDWVVGIMNGGTHADSVIENNLAFGHRYNLANNAESGVWRNNLVADPKFADPGRRDYRLAKGSPAVDSAVLLEGYLRDVDGQPRVQGDVPDRGAFERGNATDRRVRPPEVDAGEDLWTTMAQPKVTLNGAVTDDGGSDRPVSLSWKMRIGPGPVEFSVPEAGKTEAAFTVPGGYLLQLFADNGYTTAGDLVAVFVHPEIKGEGPFRVEAEHMQLESYGVQEAGFASGGRYVWQQTGMTSTLYARVPVPEGIYDVVVGYFDENDGQSKVEFRLSRQDKQEMFGEKQTLRLDWTCDEDLDGDEPSPKTAARKLIGEKVHVKPGDSLQITTIRQGQEATAIDYTEFIPRE